MSGTDGARAGASRRALVVLGVLALLAAAGLVLTVRTGGSAGLPPGGDFTLRSGAGAVSLHDLRGKAVLVFFGYLSCPGICPAALSSHAEAFRMLAPEERARVAGLFVSVDPGRDTPAAVEEYASGFDPLLHGATGTAEEVRVLAQRYGVVYTIQPAEAAGRYAVDHTADTFVVAPDGRLAARLGQDTPPEAIAAELRRWLRGPAR